MIRLSTAIWQTPGGSSTVHIYTQTVHGTTQSTIEIHLENKKHDSATLLAPQKNFGFSNFNFKIQGGDRLLTLSYRTTYIYIYIYIYMCVCVCVCVCCTAPLTSRCYILYIIQQIYVQNILNMLHTLRFFSLQNAVYFIMLPFFSSCVIHILYTGCAKI